MRTVELCNTDECCEDSCDPGPLTATDDVQFCYSLPQSISNFQSIEFAVNNYMDGTNVATLAGTENGTKYTSAAWEAVAGYYVVKAKVTLNDSSTYHLNTKVVKVEPLQP